MMPKGVEHRVPGQAIAHNLAVITSVMPKGVEHGIVGFGGTGRASDYLCDAERR